MERTGWMSQPLSLFLKEIRWRRVGVCLSARLTLWVAREGGEGLLFYTVVPLLERLRSYGIARGQNELGGRRTRDLADVRRAEWRVAERVTGRTVLLEVRLLSALWLRNAQHVHEQRRRRVGVRVVVSRGRRSVRLLRWGLLPRTLAWLLGW